MASVDRDRLGRFVSNTVFDRLERARLDQALVSFAKRRMDNAGDSRHAYPDLWDHPGSFRRGGQPLLDTRTHIYNRLSGETRRDRRKVSIVLRGPLIAAYHQHGFRTRGPNYIPLSLKGRRSHQKGVNPEEEGLVRGVDFVMAWKGVTVPQRKVFNTPPEDVADLKDTIAAAMRS
jgi:hypothetical protein